MTKQTLNMDEAQVSISTRSDFEIICYAVISLIVLTFFFSVTQFSDEISRPIIRFTNSLSGRSRFFDVICLNFAQFFTFSGVLISGLLLAYWIIEKDIEIRARILVGIVTAFGAGIISRYLQHHLSTHVRPYYDAAVNFKPPPGIEIPALNTWNSFPSDHAAVFGGLVVVLFVIRSKVRYFISAWILIVESSRMFIGAHFPSDLLGGAALASAVVWIFQISPSIYIGKQFLRLESKAPLLFYTVLFILFYQVSTLFVEIRNMTGGFSALQG